MVQVKAPPQLPKGVTPDPDFHSPHYLAFPSGEFVLRVEDENDWDTLIGVSEGHYIPKREVFDYLEAAVERGKRRPGAGQLVHMDPNEFTTIISVGVLDELEELRRENARLLAEKHALSLLSPSKDEGGDWQMSAPADTAGDTTAAAHTIRVTPEEWEGQLHGGETKCDVCGHWVRNMRMHLRFSWRNGKNKPIEHRDAHAARFPKQHAMALAKAG